MESILTREDFVEYLNERNMLGPVVEIGVNTGDFMKANLSKWKGLKYYAVDPWMWYENPAAGYINPYPDAIFEEGFKRCCELRDKDERIELVRAMSTDAAKMFPDCFCDWVYIDANHVEPYVSEDIALWWSKVKSGGIFSGHDYCDGPFQAVIDAVQKFKSESGLELHLTTEGTKSWYFIKP